MSKVITLKVERNIPGKLVKVGVGGYTYSKRVPLYQNPNTGKLASRMYVYGHQFVFTLKVRDRKLVFGFVARTESERTIRRVVKAVRGVDIRVDIYPQQPKLSDDTSRAIYEAVDRALAQSRSSAHSMVDRWRLGLQPA